MKTSWIQRIKAWAAAQLRRFGGRRGAATETARAGSDLPRRARLRAALERLGRRLAQPNGRTLVRALMFAFLVGAAYGLLQGSQELARLRSLPEPGTVAEDIVPPQGVAGRSDSAALFPDASLHTPQLATVQYLDDSGKDSALPTVQLPALPAILDLSQMVWPVTGRIDGPYGWYRDATTGDWRFRPGLVLKPDRDPAPVRASLPGRVVDVSTSGVGYRVVLEHAEGWQSEYVGLAAVSVAVGSPVNAGDTIGQFASAPHRDGLFFTMRSPQATADPGAFLYTPVSG